MVSRKLLGTRFKRKDKLGQGTFGKVFRALDRLTGATIALKELEEEEGENPEISLLPRLSHDNIVRYVAHERKRRKLIIALEFMEMNLRQYMQGKELEVKTVKWLMYQLLSGLKYCHTERVLHRDLKPGNVLIDGKSRKLRIADFGSAKSLAGQHEEQEPAVGTLWYRSPDLLLGNTTYGSGIDVWAAGCIMAEMLRDRHQALFRGETEEEQLDCIFVIMGTPTEETWPGVSQFPDYPKYEANWKIHAPQQLDKHVPRLDRDGLDLLERMLELRPEKRITAAEALEHPWLAEIKRTQDGSLALTSSERAQVGRG